MFEPAATSSSSVMVLYVVGTVTTGTFVSNWSYAARKLSTSSGLFSFEWIMMASAPASMKALARLSASSSPQPAMSASSRAMIMNSSVTLAAWPARILAQKSSTSASSCLRSVPNREFCFSPVLSSMMHAETPIASSERTVKWKISGAPPVSPS